MGSQMSKKETEASGANPINNLEYSTELNSYVAACRVDADLQSFDAMLQTRTNDVITSLASGVEARALSFDSLQKVAEWLLDMNQEVVKVILDCQKDIWNNQELFELVEEYFESSLKTMEFYAVLHKCLRRTEDNHLLLLFGLRQLDEEEGEEGVEGKGKYAKILKELRVFRKGRDPFTEEFFRSFQAVHQQQMVMLERLQINKSKLDKNLKSIHNWRRYLA